MKKSTTYIAAIACALTLEANAPSTNQRVFGDEQFNQASIQSLNHYAHTVASTILHEYIAHHNITSEDISDHTAFGLKTRYKFAQNTAKKIGKEIPDLDEKVQDIIDATNMPNPSRGYNFRNGRFRFPDKQGNISYELEDANNETLMQAAAHPIASLAWITEQYVKDEQTIPFYIIDVGAARLELDKSTYAALVLVTKHMVQEGLNVEQARTEDKVTLEHIDNLASITRLYHEKAINLGAEIAKNNGADVTQIEQEVLHARQRADKEQEQLRKNWIRQLLPQQTSPDNNDTQNP